MVPHSAVLKAEVWDDVLFRKASAPYVNHGLNSTQVLQMDVPSTSSGALCCPNLRNCQTSLQKRETENLLGLVKLKLEENDQN